MGEDAMAKLAAGLREVLKEPVWSAIPPDGAWVEVVLRGQARRHSTAPSCWVGCNLISPDAEHVVSVTVIDPPEPAWEDGAVVRDAAGEVYVRAKGLWRQGGSHWEDRVAIRPLTRLVPEEKP